MTPRLSLFSLIILRFLFTQPLPAQDWDQHIRLLLVNELYTEALEVSDTIPVTDSLADKLYYYRGKAYQSLFKYDSALHYYSLASGEDSLSSLYTLSMGQMLTKLGRTREAVEVYEDLSNREKLESNQMVELASLYTTRNRHKESLKIYLDLHENDQTNYFYLKQAGKCFQEINRSDSALACFVTALNMNPKDSYLTFQIANIYLKRKDLHNAIRHLNQGIFLDTNNLDLLKIRGYAWFLSEEYEAAFHDLEKARMLDSSSAFIQKYLGLSYFEEKLFGYAREALLQAYQLDSTDAETAFFLGSSCRWSYQEEEGVYYYKKSIELQKPDPDQLKNTCIQLAELYKVLHRFNEAKTSYDQALDYDPSDNTIYFKIGQMYDRNLDQKRLAIKYYEKYLSGGRTDQQLFDTSKGSSQALRPFVEQRINELKEDLFFENP